MHTACRSIVCLVLFTTVTLLAADKPAARPAGESSKREVRLREGAKVTDRVGRFQFSGDRATFVTSDGPGEESFRVLENLALERVMNYVNDAQGERSWQISGSVTEFRGANYLLLGKAVVLETESATTP